MDYRKINLKSDPLTLLDSYFAGCQGEVEEGLGGVQWDRH
jgi:hypothetical protein